MKWIIIKLNWIDVVLTLNVKLQVEVHDMNWWFSEWMNEWMKESLFRNDSESLNRDVNKSLDWLVGILRRRSCENVTEMKGILRSKSPSSSSQAAASELPKSILKRQPCDPATPLSASTSCTSSDNSVYRPSPNNLADYVSFFSSILSILSFHSIENQWIFNVHYFISILFF